VAGRQAGLNQPVVIRQICSETVQNKGFHVQAVFIAGSLFSLQARKTNRALQQQLEKDHETENLDCEHDVCCTDVAGPGG
jgi:hypothetical protein